MTYIKGHHVLAFFVVMAVIVAASFSLSQRAAASGSQTFTTSGTFTVPSYGSLTVTLWGGGGGGGGGGYAGGNQTNGTAGQASTFNGTLSAGGGGAGIAVSSGSGGAGSGGAGGTASGGDINTSGVAGSGGGWTPCCSGPGNTGGTGGGSPNGGAGGAGDGSDAGGAGGSGGAPGGGGGGGGYCCQSTGSGGGGGGGGYVSKTYSSGVFTPGASIDVVVGSAGAAGLNDSAQGGAAGAGAAGRVSITWTDPATCSFNGSTVNHGSSVTAYQASTVPFGSSCTSQTRTCSDGSLSGSYTYSSCSVDVPSDFITGYAWSDTIGWVSLSGSTYGISIDSDGDMSGYAWSDNIGWISANTSDLSGCPSGTCAATINSSGVVSGWLRALSGGTSQSGAWDGWISLMGSSPSYGVVEATNGTFSGYAWGSDVVGWLDFSYASTTYGADVCSNIPERQITVPDGYIESGGTCVNYCTPQSYCTGDDLYQNTIQSNACVPSFVETCSYQCVSGACATPPAPSFSSSSGFTGHLQAFPSLVRLGDSTRVHWNVSNVASCGVSGSNGDAWTGASSASAGELSSAITHQTTYTLTCDALTGVTPDSFTETITVNLVPVFQEL